MNDQTIPLISHVERVLNAACTKHNVSIQRLMQEEPRLKKGSIPAARSDVICILRSTVVRDGTVLPGGVPRGIDPISYPWIARFMGKLDHSTCILAMSRRREAGEPERMTLEEYLS